MCGDIGTRPNLAVCTRSSTRHEYTSQQQTNETTTPLTMALPVLQKAASTSGSCPPACQQRDPTSAASDKLEGLPRGQECSGLAAPSQHLVGPGHEGLRATGCTAVDLLQSRISAHMVHGRRCGRVHLPAFAFSRNDGAAEPSFCDARAGICFLMASMQHEKATRSFVLSN